MVVGVGLSFTMVLITNWTRDYQLFFFFFFINALPVGAFGVKGEFASYHGSDRLLDA